MYIFVYCSILLCHFSKKIEINLKKNNPIVVLEK